MRHDERLLFHDLGLATFASAALLAALSACGGSSGSADAGADLTAREGEPVSFAGATAESDFVAVWAFGDGETVEGSLTPEHVYDDEGSYEVTLQILVGDQEVARDTLTVTVENQAPTVTAEGEAEWAPGELYVLSALIADPGSFDAVTADVDWGDGQVDRYEGNLLVDELVATHIYAGDGDYDITITVDDGDGGTETDTNPVTIASGQRLFADFLLRTWTPAGEQVLGKIRAWDFDDQSLTLRLAQGPDGLAFDPITGLIDWTPTADQAGSHTIAVEITDGQVTETFEHAIDVAALAAQASTTIGPDGGQVAVAEGPLAGVSLDIPAGALTTDTEITIALPSSVPADAGGDLVFELLPSGLTFARPVTLEVPYDPTGEAGAGSLATYLQPDQLTDTGASLWAAVPTVTDEGDATVSASITHFCAWRHVRGPGWTPHYTEHFQMLYRTSAGNQSQAQQRDIPLEACKTPFSSNCYVAKGLPPVDGVPTYVSELGLFLEDAYKAYEEDFAAALEPGEEKYVVIVQDLAPANANGLAFAPPCLGIAMHSQRWHWRDMADTAYHEMFHIMEFRAFDSVEARKSFAVASAWLYEASAVSQALKAFPFEVPPQSCYSAQQNQSPPSCHHYAEARYLFDQSIDAPPSWGSGTWGGYAGFALFEYFEQHAPQLPALTEHLFGNDNPYVATDPIEIGEYHPRAYFDRMLASLVPDKEERLRLWSDFAVTYQHTRSPTWIRRIQHWLDPNPLPTTVASLPSGLERRDGDGDATAVPRPLDVLLTDQPGANLAPGHMATFVVDFRRVLGSAEPGDPIPAPRLGDPGTTFVGGLSDNLSDWDVVLRLSGPDTLYASIYDIDPSGAAEPVWLGALRGPFSAEEDREWSMPVTDLAEGHSLALAVINDPYQSPGGYRTTAPVSAEVFFEGGSPAAVFHWFDRNLDTSSIWRVDGESGEAERVFVGENYYDVSNPRLSPDRDYIVFGRATSPMWMIGPDGQAGPVPGPPGYYASTPISWHPDGEHVIYGGELSVDGRKIWLHNVFTGDRSELAHPMSSSGSLTLKLHDVSPDGTLGLLLLASYTSINEIRLLDFNGGGLRTLFDTESAGLGDGLITSAAFSTDGNRIYFHYGDYPDQPEVYEVELDTGVPVRLTSPDSHPWFKYDVAVTVEGTDLLTTTADGIRSFSLNGETSEYVVQFADPEFSSGIRGLRGL